RGRSRPLAARRQRPRRARRVARRARRRHRPLHGDDRLRPRDRQPLNPHHPPLDLPSPSRGAAPVRPLRLLGATGAVLVLTATAAAAHPSFNPNAVPVGEAVDTVLVIPHGCSTTDSVRPDSPDQAVATTRIDLQLLDGVTIEPHDVDGWDAIDDGEAIVWTDAGGATTDPIE